MQSAAEVKKRRRLARWFRKQDQKQEHSNGTDLHRYPF
jgi:hypothetical protein